jgi:hypothetical protein
LVSPLDHEGHHRPEQLQDWFANAPRLGLIPPDTRASGALVTGRARGVVIGGTPFFALWHDTPAKN